MKRKGHQFSNLSQSPFLSVLFKGTLGQEGFPKENLPGIPSQPFSSFFCPFFFLKKKAMKKDEKGRLENLCPNKNEVFVSFPSENLPVPKCL